MRRRPRVRVEAIQSGGGQERGMRSGTVPAPLAVGLGAACELAQTEMEVIFSRNPANVGCPIRRYIFYIFSTITNTSKCSRIA